jgi:hypothetical protein
MKLEERAKAAFLSWDNAYQPGMDTWESITEADRENWRNIIREADKAAFKIPEGNEFGGGQITLEEFRREVNKGYRLDSFPVSVIFGMDPAHRIYWVGDVASFKINGVMQFAIMVVEPPQEHKG